MHMHPAITTEIAALRIAEWHQQAARHRAVPQLRVAHAAGSRNGRVRADRVRLSLHHSRPAAA
jgi:hypothetical protein